MKKAGILVILMVFLLTGCFAQRDIQFAGLIRGISYDVGENGNYRYVCQIETNGDMVIFEGETATLGEIGQEIIRQTGIITYQLNTELIVVSKQVAKKGISQIINALYTYGGSEGEEQIIIAKEDAKELLLAGNMPNSQNKLMEMLENFDSSSGFSDCSLQKIVQDTVSDAKTVLVPVFELKDNRAEPAAMAVLEEYKMAMELTEDEAKGALLIREKKFEGMQSISIDENTQVGVEIVQGEVDIKIYGDLVEIRVFCVCDPIDKNSFARIDE